MRKYLDKVLSVAHRIYIFSVTINFQYNVFSYRYNYFCLKSYV